MRDRAQVVIVGGGVHGASLLWHLAREGCTDAILVEKAELTSGSTWHAAGQITRSVGDYTTAAIAHYAIELYNELPALTGHEIQLHQPGGIRVAYTDHEVEALKAQLGVGRYIGYPIELIGPSEAEKINPLYDFTDVKAAIWTEGEAHVDPTDVTMAFAQGARAMGAEISRRNRVLEINELPNGEWSVVTEKGTITCEHVVDAAGCYAHQVGLMADFAVPQANVLHHYLVTDEVPELVDLGFEMPVMRDNRVAGYIRQEQTSGLIGIYEHAGAESIWDDGVPWDAENPLFPEDYDKIAPWLEEAFARVPSFAEVGIKRVIHGAITHTTDAHMLLGPAPGVRNFWLNTGSSIGLAWGPGAGRELARWIVHGETELSLRHYDPRRFAWADNDTYIRPKAIEDYEWMFQVQPPGIEHPLARPNWTSSLYEKLTAKGAIHTQAYGWEQPKWFNPGGGDAIGWLRPDWYPTVRDECETVRERVGVMDLSAFSKYEITGPDAKAYLHHLTTGRLPSQGRIGLNYVLTPSGRIETEVTLTKLTDDRYYMVSGPVGLQRDLDWFTQHIDLPGGPTFDVEITDLTRAHGTLVVAGPNARALLSACTDTDLSNEAFGFLTGQHLSIDTADGPVDALALRVGFTGSRGWELHVAMDDMPAVYDALWVADAAAAAAGAPLGLGDFGSHALNSLRMEKAYLTRFELTHDIGPEAAGVMRWVKPDKGDFIGRDALDRPSTGNDWRLVYLQVDVPDGPEAADCVGGEGVFVADRAVGLTTSGGYGFTIDQSLAFAYVAADVAAPGTELSVLVLGEPRAAVVLDGPAWDPANEQLRG